jgi:hypothetical protein
VKIPEPLSLFLDWVLLDRAIRPPSGKNPKSLMTGIWVAYQPSGNGRGKVGARRALKLRGSDVSLRRYVVILALRDSGLTLDAACWELAARLGKTTLAQKETIKTGFHKFRPASPPDRVLASWRGRFEGWRRSVKGPTEASIIFLAGRLAHDPDRGQQVADDFRDLARRAQSLS